MDGGDALLALGFLLGEFFVGGEAFVAAGGLEVGLVGFGVVDGGFEVGGVVGLEGRGGGAGGGGAVD